MELISLFSSILLGGIVTGTMLYTVGADLLAAGSRRTVQRGPDDQPAVALTFDDGPDPLYTPRILEVLHEFGAHATFFVIGRRAEQHPQIIRTIAGAGHELGNHTYGHRPLWLLPPHHKRAQIERGAQVLSTILGQPPRFFRPPWGRFNWEAVRHSARVRQSPVLWSLRPEGWLPLVRPQRIFRNVAQGLHPGAILDLHDAGGLCHTPVRTLAALPATLGLLRERGYGCLILSELLAKGTPGGREACWPHDVWDWYERVWNAWHRIETLGQDTILTLGPATHCGPDLLLQDGTMIQFGTGVGELHLDRRRVAQLHRSVPPHCLGLCLRRDREGALRQLARQLLESPHEGALQAFRSTTLFWKEAERLGFEVCAQRTDWRLRCVG